MAALNIMEDQLLSRIVNDFGRSMGAVRSATQALLNGADRDAEFRGELLRGMEKELGRLQHQLDNITYYQMMEAGGVKLEITSIAAFDWLTQLTYRWQDYAGENGLSIAVDIPADLPAIPGDMPHLSLALDNLFRNAVENTPPGGRISVGAGIKEGGIWISIGDTGSGIPLDEAEHIFKPFYQVKRRSRFPKGLGLGLCIAHNLIVAHGGWVSVDSSLEGGSNFTIWLPIYSR